MIPRQSIGGSKSYLISLWKSFIRWRVKHGHRRIRAREVKTKGGNDDMTMPNHEDGPDSSARHLTIAICNCHARTLLDLALQSYFDYEGVLGEFEDVASGYSVCKDCRHHSKDLRQMTTLLQEIIGNLRGALDMDQTSPPSLE